MHEERKLSIQREDACFRLNILQPNLSIDGQRLNLQVEFNLDSVGSI
jgi:hypothetical protein